MGKSTIFIVYLCIVWTMVKNPFHSLPKKHPLHFLKNVFFWIRSCRCSDLLFYSIIDLPYCAGWLHQLDCRRFYTKHSGAVFTSPSISSSFYSCLFTFTSFSHSFTHFFTPFSSTHSPHLHPFFPPSLLPSFHFEVANFQERMQLRRSLIELEDQNVQNGIEVRPDTAILRHTHTHTHTLYTITHCNMRTRTCRWVRGSCSWCTGPRRRSRPPLRTAPPPPRHPTRPTRRYCTISYCAALYCTVLHGIVLYCTILYHTALHYTVLHCAVLHYTLLYYSVLCTLCVRAETLWHAFHHLCEVWLAPALPLCLHILHFKCNTMYK